MFYMQIWPKFSLFYWKLCKFSANFMVVNLYLDARATNGMAPIKASISDKSKKILIPMGVKIYPSQWDGDNRMVKDHPRKKEINAFLAGKKSDIEIELLRLERLGKLKGASLAQIKQMILRFLNGGGEDVRFVDRYQHFLSLKTAKKTKKGYKWTLDALRHFDSGLDQRTFDDIGVDYIKDFVNYCCRKGLNRNSINIHLRYIRAVFNDAISAGITQAYPFRSVSIKPLPVRKKALTPDQLRLLFTCPCEPWQAEYRDQFKLMFYLRGVNAKDLLTAKPSQVVNGRFEYRRSKVGTLFSVKIEPEADEIIEKYRGLDYLLSPLDRYLDYEDYLHHMNDALKSIGRPLGKRGKVLGSGYFPELTSNWARHSWASTGILLDIPKEIISRGLGHSFGVAVTEVYIDFDFKKLDDANRKIMNFILSGRTGKDE